VLHSVTFIRFIELAFMHQLLCQLLVCTCEHFGLPSLHAAPAARAAGTTRFRAQIANLEEFDLVQWLSRHPFHSPLPLRPCTTPPACLPKLYRQRAFPGPGDLVSDNLIVDF
jgi:hypothetical protein